MAGVARLLVGGLVCTALLVGCGGGSSSHTHSTGETAKPEAASKPHPAIPLSPALRKLRATLRKTLRQAGRSSGVLVYDLDRQGVLFSENASVRRPPASVEKLYTTVALLRKLGADKRLHTGVLGTGHLAPGGVWTGNLYLHGGGDPTLGDGAFNKIWELGYGPTGAQLAAQLRAKGIRRVTGQLIGDESALDTRRGGPETNYAPDTPDYGGQLSALSYDHGSTSHGLGPAAFAARQLARTLKAEGVQVAAATRPGRAPHHARRLARVSSPPMSVLLRLMDVPSDDLFAELLTEQLGRRFEHDGTIAGGAKVISAEIAAYGLHPRIVDGSGLSRADSSSPREVVALLRDVFPTEVGRVLSASLPTVGVNGTVRRIGTGTAAQGRCIAKTGTLNYVTNLAGYCRSRGHHRIAFALFIDGPQNWQALVLVSRMVAAIAKY
jgi:D-alanyl-D-alanine carboxypeptidase/D-alanyl-D-alanine-endopeptidase (penicillin-binding protein 4)